MDLPEIPIVDSEQGRPSIALRNWLIEQISPYLKGRILELGSGQGAISALLFENGIALHLSDPSKDNVSLLRETFKESSLLKSVHTINYNLPNFFQIYTKVAGVFSTVLAVNIFDKGFFDESIISKASFLLGSGGHLILLGPAHTIPLYDTEESSEEIKRFIRKALKPSLAQSFEILLTEYHNFIDQYQGRSVQQLGSFVLTVTRKKQSA